MIALGILGRFGLGELPYAYDVVIVDGGGGGGSGEGGGSPIITPPSPLASNATLLNLRAILINGRIELGGVLFGDPLPLSSQLIVNEEVLKHSREVIEIDEVPDLAPRYVYVHTKTTIVNGVTFVQY